MTSVNKDIEKLTRAYIKFRDDKRILKREYEEKEAEIEKSMTEIETILIRRLNSIGVDSVKTPYGTAFTKVETKSSCSDWPSYWNWMKEHDRMDCVEKRVSQAAIRQFIEDGVSLPPGIETYSEKVIVIRRD